MSNQVISATLAFVVESFLEQVCTAYNVLAKCLVVAVYDVLRDWFCQGRQKTHRKIQRDYH